jgi:DNA-binding NarL/FixJ family response regulator
MYWTRMDRKVPRILLLEDGAGDTALRAALDSAGTVTVMGYAAQDALTDALRTAAPDVILVRHETSPSEVQALLDVVRAGRSAAGVILVVDTVDPNDVVASVRAGVEHVVFRGGVDRLRETIERAVTVREPLRRLTARQLEVFRLIVEGQRAAEIAQQLGLSVKTVESHRAEVMKRLGARDVPELVRYAVRVGLVDAQRRREAPVSGREAPPPS